MHQPTVSDRDVHVAGGFSLDAILFADGSFETERIGGNAVWAAMGVLAGGGRPVAHGVVGRDYPARVLSDFTDAGIDVANVRRHREGRGVRVTYQYTPDGVRLQPAPDEALIHLPAEHREKFIDTTRSPFDMLGALPTAADLPIDGTGTFWHLGLLPVARFHELVSQLRASGVRHLQVDTPARSELRTQGWDALGDALADVDVFLPSTSDTDVFAPDLSPTELIDRCHDLGAPVVVLKCAEDGALVSTGAAVWHVPIHPEPQASDPTGCGDVFAGAFAAAIVSGADPVDAACAGAAAASFATRHTDPRGLPSLAPSQIRLRRKHIAQRVTRL
ncbi:carbohydrate kinase family protein [Microbacterium caowuchunii]|uniref:Carbohydrate kinase family protein n=1 Tax=Microbacterium caowuchunii TaxID=2614638 RepID=A0A5N0TCG0_9MICO|nr:carbohydrate kinase family protein [Microbacterium caowuchunii]KAA9132358.1 carbohydrate kinase family protein [Microbacterium caowuchunii]